MLGSVAEAEDVDAGGAAAPARRDRRREPRGVPHHRRPRGSPSTSCAPPACAARPTPARGCRSRWSRTTRPAASRTRRRSRSPSSSCSSASAPTSAPCSCCASRSTTSSPTSPRSSTPRRPTRARSSAAPAAASTTSARASTPTRSERRALAARFLAAARDGDMDGLVALLAPDAVLVGDGGGKARAIAAPMHGAAAHRPRADRVLRPERGSGASRSSRRWSTASPASASRPRRAARQRRLARRRGRRGAAHPLDAQPRQARPPRARSRTSALRPVRATPPA